MPFRVYRVCLSLDRGLPTGSRLRSQQQVYVRRSAADLHPEGKEFPKNLRRLGAKKGCNCPFCPLPLPLRLATDLVRARRRSSPAFARSELDLALNQSARQIRRSNDV